MSRWNGLTRGDALIELWRGCRSRQIKNSTFLFLFLVYPSVSVYQILCRYCSNIPQLQPPGSHQRLSGPRFELRLCDPSQPLTTATYRVTNSFELHPTVRYLPHKHNAESQNLSRRAMDLSPAASGACWSFYRPPPLHYRHESPIDGKGEGLVIHNLAALAWYSVFLCLIYLHFHEPFRESSSSEANITNQPPKPAFRLPVPSEWVSTCVHF